ncbi:MAG: LysR family transcriptional regulator [Proteobacteria bacterium]|nr:LysR family transcriptional regulator [Pseudomonadota bacterium]
MLPQLMVFEAVARLGSFTRAGEELCLAQPTVSVQVRKLSESLGLPLLEQSGRKIVLTEAGKEVYETVQVLFRFFIAADERLEALRRLRGVKPPAAPAAEGGLLTELGAG